MIATKKQIFENLALKNMENLYTKAISLAESMEGAEYLVQLTFAVAFEVFEQYDKNSSFGTWLNDTLMLVYSNTQLGVKVSVDNWSGKTVIASYHNVSSGKRHASSS